MKLFDISRNENLLHLGSLSWDFFASYSLLNVSKVDKIPMFFLYVNKVDLMTLKLNCDYSGLFQFNR